MTESDQESSESPKENREVSEEDVLVSEVDGIQRYETETLSKGGSNKENQRELEKDE